MSREIDLTKPLSEEDKQYLLIRGREYEVQQNALAQSAPQKPVHTGDVNPLPDEATATPGVRSTTPQVTENAATRAAAAGMPGIVTDDDEDDEDEAAASEPLEPPYDREGVTKEMLIAEIERRNALPENAEYEDISTSGNKAALVAALVEDDEASE